MTGRQAIHDEVEAVRITLVWGARMTLGVVLVGLVYATQADGLRHADAITVAMLSAIPSTVAIRAVPARVLTAWRHRNLFFATWSLLCVAQITVVVALDRADGPLAALFFMPLLFVVISYPRWLVALLGTVTVAAYVGVAVLQDGVSLWTAMFYAVALAWTGIFALVATSEQLRQRRTIAALSLRDPLTGLPNRAVRGHADTDRAVGVLFFDLDDFKVVNDSLGHPAGDSLLCQVVERLRAGLRGEHLIARFGGDELVVVCERLAAADDAVAIAERLAGAISAAPFQLASGEHHVTASVGVAVDATGSADADVLIRDADAAMYRAKNAGRGRVEVFDEQLRRRMVDRIGLERDLRRALDRDELFVVFQPIVSFVDARPRVEALVRWRHPERGVVPPLDFIGVAEETGLIHELGERVLRLACAQVAAWQREVPGMADHRVSVNVSARQLADSAFPDRVAAALEVSGLPAGSLVLEITESAVMDHVDGAREQLDALRALGASLSLDDFGTGHSSVTSLLHLPVIAIKIDRAFVADICVDERQASVVRGLVALATDLGIHTIVEGVETREQLDRLQELGCRNFQGYFFSRPVEPGDYLAWAAESVLAVG
jgi:diguanylate cyclase (GGDEF)-like protein